MLLFCLSDALYPYYYCIIFVNFDFKIWKLRYDYRKRIDNMRDFRFLIFKKSNWQTHNNNKIVINNVIRNK